MTTRNKRTLHINPTIAIRVDQPWERTAFVNWQLSYSRMWPLCLSRSFPKLLKSNNLLAVSELCHTLLTALSLEMS